MTTSSTLPEIEVDTNGAYPIGSIVVASPNGFQTYRIAIGPESFNLITFSMIAGNQHVELTKDGFQITPLSASESGSTPEETPKSGS